MDFEKARNKFAEKFKNCEGFYGQTIFVDDEFGFSIKRKLNSEDKDNTSLIKLYISKKDIKSTIDQKEVRVSISYGKDYGDSVSMRDLEKTKFSDPQDLFSEKEYYYNINDNKFFIKRFFGGAREISACDMLRRVYGNHIKSTKILQGLLLRSKLYFWHIVVRRFVFFCSKSFHYCLYVISGDRYTYEPIFGEERINGRIISSRWENRISEPKESFTSGEKIDVFGYKARSHSVIFYACLQLFLYLTFETLNLRPYIIVRMLQNNFLVLMYAIVSLWIIEAEIPKILKYLIKNSSKLSFECMYRKIKI